MSATLQTPPNTERDNTEGPNEDEMDVSGNENVLQQRTRRNEELGEPFDISSDPASMTTDDHPSQDNALEAAIASLPVDEGADFNRQQVYERLPQTIRRRYQINDEGPKPMGNRQRVKWRNSEEVVSSENPDIYWNSNEFFLDLLICRGRSAGIAALVPRVPVHHGIDFELELRRSVRTFSGKFAHLQFNPEGAMQYIGRTHRKEDAWIAWIPNEAVGDMLDDAPMVEPGTCTGSTQLSTRHYNGAYMFFAGELNDMGIKDISVWERYPDLDGPDGVKYSTNLR